MCVRKKKHAAAPEGDAPRLEDEGGTVRDGESEAVGRDVQAAQVDVAQLVRKRLAYSRPEAWGGADHGSSGSRASDSPSAQRETGGTSHRQARGVKGGA